MRGRVNLKNRTALFCTGASSFALFGVCGYYLTAIQPLGPCLSSGFQLLAFLLGIAAFCIGTAMLIAWVVWTGVVLLRRAKQPPIRLGLP
jgi:hypothetical protein